MVRRMGVLLVLVLSCVVHGAPADAVVAVSYTVSDVITVRPDQFRVQKLKCPSGTKVISGGWQITGSEAGARILASVPYDGKDGDSKPDDGWKNVFFNASELNRLAVTFANCSSDASVRYLKKTATALANNETRDTVPCAATEKVVGGGAGFKEQVKTLTLVGTVPVDDDDIADQPDPPTPDDGDATPDDGWRGTFANFSSKPHKVSLVAICATGLTLSYVAQPTPVAGSSAASGTAVCGLLNGVLGGGGEVSSSEAMVLASNGAWDDPGGGEPDQELDDGWQTIAFNAGPNPENMNTIAICQSL